MLTTRLRERGVECAVEEFTPHDLGGCADCEGRRYGVVVRGRISERVGRVVVDGARVVVGYQSRLGIQGKPPRPVGNRLS